MASAARLYSPEVLSLATGLARWPLTPDLPLSGSARSPACGSTLTLGLDVDDAGRIERLGLRAQACAIGQAAAAIFAEHATGADRAALAGTLATLDYVTLPACTASSPKTLADNISGVRFDYWRFGSGSTPLPLALTDPQFTTLLAYVDIALSAIPATGLPISYRTRVLLRNGAWGTKK